MDGGRDMMTRKGVRIPKIDRHHPPLLDVGGEIFGFKRQRVARDDRLDHLNERCLVDDTELMPDHLSLIDEDQHGDALHAEALGDHRCPIDVDLDNLQLTLEARSDSLDDGCELLAGLAPIRVEIDKDGKFAAKNLLLKIRVAYFDDRHGPKLADAASLLQSTLARPGSARL